MLIPVAYLSIFFVLFQHYNFSVQPPPSYVSFSVKRTSTPFLYYLALQKVNVPSFFSYLSPVNGQTLNTIHIFRDQPLHLFSFAKRTSILFLFYSALQRPTSPFFSSFLFPLSSRHLFSSLFFSTTPSVTNISLHISSSDKYTFITILYYAPPAFQKSTSPFLSCLFTKRTGLYFRHFFSVTPLQ